jgi:hypothetical protein
MAPPRTADGASRPGFNYDTDFFIERERQRRAAQANAGSGGSGPASAGTQWRGTYSFQQPEPYQNSMQVPLRRGAGGYSGIPLTAPYWAPASVVNSPTFYGGGYFSGTQGREFALQLEALARTVHTNSTGGTMWDAFTTQSAWLATPEGGGIIVTPYELAAQWAASGGGVYDQARGIDGSDGGGSYSYGGGGGYGGGGYGGASVGSVNLTNPEDARAVINQLAVQMLGRTVSDREFKQYYQALNELEMSSPQTVRMDVDDKGNPVQVVEGGLGAEGRTALLQEQLRTAKDFNEQTIGSQAVDLMGKYLQERGVFRG